jgi:putative two-component system response regulator
MGLPEPDVEVLRRAAPLHDIGKIGIPDTILLKRGPLTPEEFALMQSHARIGAEILSGSEFAILNSAEQIAAAHHERWDGRGYPNGLAGAAIPLSARMVAVADVFDALTHERPYKDAWPLARAVEEIALLGGTQFDPEVARTFAALDHSALLSPIARTSLSAPPARHDDPYEAVLRR